LSLEDFKTKLLHEDGFDLTDETTLNLLFTDSDIKITCVSLSDGSEETSEENESLSGSYFRSSDYIPEKKLFDSMYNKRYVNVDKLYRYAAEQRRAELADLDLEEVYTSMYGDSLLSPEDYKIEADEFDVYETFSFFLYNLKSSKTLVLDYMDDVFYDEFSEDDVACVSLGYFLDLRSEIVKIKKFNTGNVSVSLSNKKKLQQFYLAISESTYFKTSCLNSQSIFANDFDYLFFLSELKFPRKLNDILQVTKFNSFKDNIFSFNLLNNAGPNNSYELLSSYILDEDFTSINIDKISGLVQRKFLDLYYVNDKNWNVVKFFKNSLFFIKFVKRLNFFSLNMNYKISSLKNSLQYIKLHRF
jgi:hypothetical protein